MAGLQLKNNASGTLAASIDNSQTTIGLTAGHGARFPSLGAGDWFPLTLVDASANREIVKVTARTTDTLTVERAQEGTLARAFDAGSKADLRLTVGAMSQLPAGSLATPRTFQISGAAVASGISFDGTGNVNFNVTSLLASALSGTAPRSVLPAPTEADVGATRRAANADVDGMTDDVAFLTTAKAARLFGKLLPAGIGPIPWAGTEINLPAGWLLCYGQAVSRVDYAALFTAIGVTFGNGDGSTTFNLPDLRGRAPFGKDNMGGTAANRVTTAESGISGVTLGAVGGAQSVALTVAQLPEHDHSPPNGGAFATPGASGGTNTHYDTSTDDNRPTASKTGKTGGNATHPNMPPAQIFNWIIKA